MTDHPSYDIIQCSNNNIISYCLFVGRSSSCYRLDGCGHLGRHCFSHRRVNHEGRLSPCPPLPLLLSIVRVRVVRPPLVSGQGVQGGEVARPIACVVKVRGNAAVRKLHLKITREGEVPGPALCRRGPVGSQVPPEEELVLCQLPVEELHCP